MKRHQTFAALTVPNYRRYFTGQILSRIGTWMQAVALTWLVLQETGSATWVGAVLGAQTLPLLLLTPYTGVLADRYDRRTLLIRVQLLRAGISSALTIAALTDTGAWTLLPLAALAGTGQALDMPARQAYIAELVGREHLANAISLNSLLANSARLLGPALAGILLATTSAAICFLVDATSYLILLAALHTIKPTAKKEVRTRQRGQLREGLHAAKNERNIRVPLLMMAVIGTLTYEFQVTLPLLAERELAGDASTYGYLMSALGAGAVLGAVYAARQGSSEHSGEAATLFGIAVLLTAASAHLPAQPWPTLTALLLTGAAGILYTNRAATLLQLSSPSRLRGRTMALWVTGFQGSSALGAPLVGILINATSASVALLLGGIAAVLTGILGSRALNRPPPGDTPIPPEADTPNPGSS